MGDVGGRFRVLIVFDEHENLGRWGEWGWMAMRNPCAIHH